MLTYSANPPLCNRCRKRVAAVFESDRRGRCEDCYADDQITFDDGGDQAVRDRNRFRKLRLFPTN